MTLHVASWLVCEIVEETIELSLPELCHSCDASAELVAELVAHGLLEPAGAAPEWWRFAGTSLATTRRAARLMQDLELNAPGAAVVIELLERIDELQRKLR